MQQAINVTPVDVPGDARYCLIQLNDVSMAASREKLLREQTELLRTQTFSDGLTGVANRRYFDTVIDKELRRAKRNGAFLSLLMIDIDYFKPYNDHYGHQQGDDCLIRVILTPRRRCGSCAFDAAAFDGFLRHAADHALHDAAFLVLRHGAGAGSDLRISSRPAFRAVVAHAGHDDAQRVRAGDAWPRSGTAHPPKAGGGSPAGRRSRPRGTARRRAAAACACRPARSARGPAARGRHGALP
jgi:hypothetical protein